MSALSNYGENTVLSWLFTDAALTRPTALYVALHTADPTETGAEDQVTTSNDADYARKVITMAAPVDGTSLCSSAVSWTINSGSSGFTVTHVSIWDALSAGNCLVKGSLLVPRVMVANGVLTFNIGDIIATID